jgi:hypothetical protein
MAWHGRHGGARRGTAWLGKAWHGMAGEAWLGKARLGRAWHGRHITKVKNG